MLKLTTTAHTRREGQYRLVNLKSRFFTPLFHTPPGEMANAVVRNASIGLSYGMQCKTDIWTGGRQRELPTPIVGFNKRGLPSPPRAAAAIGAALAAVACAIGVDAASPTPLAGEILALTGGRRAKVVWARVPPGGVRVEHVTGYWVADKSDPGKRLPTAIMGFDTDEGVERVIVPAPVTCNMPWITHDGSKVIYSDFLENTSYVVDWDGRNRRAIGTGRYRYAAAYWRDPETGVEWVYFSLPYLQQPGHDAMMSVNAPEAMWHKEGDPAIVRRRLDGRGDYETVWDKTSSWYEFRLSADGTHAGGSLPIWPDCQVVNLREGTIQRYGTGCVPNFAPDNSYRFFWFLGSHTQITMADYGNVNLRTIRLDFPRNNLPGAEAWPIRWSSDVRFVALSGPWSQNNLYANANVQLGRFNPEFTAFEQWVTLTQTPGHLDNEPYLWVEPTGAVARATVAAGAQRREPSEALPTDLRFRWENGHWQDHPVVVFSADGVRRKDVFLRQTGEAHLGGHYQMRLRRGAFIADDGGRYLADGVNRSGAFTVSLMLSPSSIEKAGPREILVLESDGHQPDLVLAQHLDRLGVKVRTDHADPAWIQLGALPHSVPIHLVMVASGRQLTLYVNSRESAQVALPGKPDGWVGDRLRFGGGQDRERHWDGELESISLHDRAFTVNEILDQFERHRQAWRQREPIPRLVVDARLLRRSAVIEPGTLPYPRALSLFAYEVRQVLAGEHRKRLLYVYHWTMMDNQILPIATREIGREYRLTLEPFANQEQLESECQSNTLPDEDVDIYHTLYHDIGVP